MSLSIVRSLYIDIMRTVRTLYTENLCICTLCTDNPCMHQKIGFFYNSENFVVMISDLWKLQCIHEILLMLSSSEYIFNNSQEIHTKNAFTGSSHKNLSINTPKYILTRISPLIHKKDDLQESIAILFILSSSRSLNPFSLL
jgi:hypothetical protein